MKADDPASAGIGLPYGIDVNPGVTFAHYVSVGKPLCTCGDPKYSGCVKHSPPPQPTIHWNGPVDAQGRPYVDGGTITTTQRQGYQDSQDSDPLSRFWQSERLSSQRLRERLKPELP